MQIGIKKSDALFSIVVLVIWPLIICLSVSSEFDVSRMTLNQWMMVVACVFGGMAITHAIYFPIINRFLAFCKELEVLANSIEQVEPSSVIRDDLDQKLQYLGKVDEQACRKILSQMLDEMKQADVGDVKDEELCDE